MSPAPRVLAIGSCRIRRPLRHAHAAGDVELVNDTGAAWFTHSAAEAIQYVRALRGTHEVPDFYRDLICEAAVDLPEDLTTPDKLLLDAAVIELCTLKSISLDGHNLNVQMVSSLAWRTHDVDKWSVLHGRTVPWPDDLEHMHRIQVTTYDQDRLRAEIAELKVLLGVPLIIVDHIPAAGIPDRAALSGMLAAVCAQLGATFLPTTDLLGDTELADATTDENHWARPFEDVAGARIAETVAGLVLAAVSQR